MYVSNHFNDCIKLFAPCGNKLAIKKILFLFLLTDTKDCNCFLNIKMKSESESEPSQYEF